MNYSLLKEQQDIGIDISPRLLQYIKAKEYHNYHNIKPPITLDEQFQITHTDRQILNKYYKKKELKNQKKVGPQPIKKKKVKNNISRLKKPINKCSSDGCAIYSSIKSFDRSLMGEILPKNRTRHPYTYDYYKLKEGVESNNEYTSKRDSHPWLYNNDIIERQTPYTSESNRISTIKLERKRNQISFPENKKDKNCCDIKLSDTTLTNNDFNSFSRNNKRDSNNDKPIKYFSLDFMDRKNQENTPYPEQSIPSKFVDFDTLLRYSTYNDKKKSRVISKMDQSNKWIDYQNTDCKKIPNVDHIQYKTTPYMGHGKGMGNVDVESMMLHAEPSRIPGHKSTGGVSINRFEDLFVDVQQNSVYPFDFPRGGMSSREQQFYEDQPAKII